MDYGGVLLTWLWCPRTGDEKTNTATNQQYFYGLLVYSIVDSLVIFYFQCIGYYRVLLTDYRVVLFTWLWCPRTGDEITNTATY